MTLPNAKIDPNGFRPRGNRIIQEDGTLRDINEMVNSDGSVRVILEGPTAEQLTVDGSTNALAGISYEHHEIHSGSHFYICGFETLDEDAEADFVVETPNTAKWLHMSFAVTGTSQTELAIYEGATVAADGTLTTPLNNNRNSDKVSVATVRKNPTVSNAGTLIYQSSSGLAATNPTRADIDGLIQREREIILRQNTKYLFRITSRQDNNIVNYCGEWYEHTDKTVLPHTESSSSSSSS